MQKQQQNFTQKRLKKKHKMVDTYGGKLVENITQAVAYDILYKD